MGYIYKITNNINGHSYIGQTSRTIEDRIQEHFKAVDNKELREKRPLYRAIHKYGKENFSITQLEKCENELLNEREIYWIEFFDTYRNGYNATIGGDSVILFTKKEEEKIVDFYLEDQTASITKIANDYNVSITTIHNILAKHNILIKKKPLYDYYVISEKYKEFQNLVDTAAFFQCSIEIVRRACKKYGVKVLDANTASRDKRCKTVYQIDLNSGEIINSFPSLKEAGKFLGNPNYSMNIGAVCRGKQTTAYGYRWTYDKEQYSKNYNPNKKCRAVLKINKDTNEVIKKYFSVADAADELCGIREGKQSSSIASCARGEYQTAYGYKWEYEDLHKS